MAAQYKVVFNGGVLDGFDAAQVRLAAADKLKADAVQIERLFSGRRAVLKKDLADDKAQQYLRVLRRIGMDVSLEEEAGLLAPVQLDLMPVEPAPPTAPPTAAPAPFDPLKTQIARHGTVSPTVLSSEDYDPEKTLLANPALAAGQVDELPPPAAAPDHEQTLIVSPSATARVLGNLPPATSAASSEVTMIVSRDDAAAMIARQAGGGSAAADEATMIVSPADAARFMEQNRAAASHEATLIVSPGAVSHYISEQKAAASGSHEATLIVSPSQVAGYVKQQAALAAEQAPALPTAAPQSRSGLYFVLFVVVLALSVSAYLIWG